jgi:flagellar M-ring protein FliF
MAEERKNAIDQVRAFFGRLTVSQKLFLGLAAALAVAAVFVVVTMARNVGYGVLYSNLNIKDSGVIMEKLKEKKVPYRIEGGGTVIQIPENRIGEMRIELAAEGLPEGGGVGFEIFDKTSLATTDFVQNVNYVRALEGELARSLAQIREVSSAKVHITPSKQSVFIEDQRPAKASVVLKLKPGAMLSGSIVPAIVHLVAQSVDGLTPDNIAVIDVYGRLLSQPRSEGANGFDPAAGEQMAYQRRMEESYTRQILDLLEPIVGPGRVRADVRLNLDFSKVETKQEAVDPNTVAKISEQSETSSSSGPSAGGGGVPGVASNVVAAGGVTGGATTAGAPAKSKSEKSVVNYEVTKTITHTVRPVGEIRNLSAAVVVDDASDVNLSGGKLQRTSRARSAAELDKLRKLVQATVGFNPTRGDTIEVTNLSFDTASETETNFLAGRERSSELIRTAIPYAAWLLGLLLLFFLVLKPMARRVGEIFRHGAPAVAGSEMMEIPTFDGGKMAELQEAKDAIEIEKELLEKYKQPKEAKKMAIIRDRVKEFAQKEPDAAASLIRSFLMEDGGK